MKRSQRQEKDGARRHGGRVNPRSGAGELFKSDVRTDDSLIEFKTTQALSYRLRLSDLFTAWKHALLDGDRSMVFGIEFGGDQNSELIRQGAPTSYVLQTEADYLAMKVRIKDLEETLAADAAWDRGQSPSY
jgi:hypothetical protein